MGELVEELPRLEPSRELLLLDGWLGSVLGVAELDDLLVSLLLVDNAPWAEDCCEDVGIAGDAALAAEFAVAAPLVEIDPLAVCMELEGVECKDGAPGLCPARGDDVVDWSLMCFST